MVNRLIALCALNNFIKYIRYIRYLLEIIIFIFIFLLIIDLIIYFIIGFKNIFIFNKNLCKKICVYDLCSYDEKILFKHFIQYKKISKFYFFYQYDYFFVENFDTCIYDNECLLYLSFINRNKLFIQFKNKPLILIKNKLDHYRNWYIFVHICSKCNMNEYYINFCYVMSNLINFILILFDNFNNFIIVFVYDKYRKKYSKYYYLNLKSLIEYLNLIDFHYKL